MFRNPELRSSIVFRLFYVLLLCTVCLFYGYSALLTVARSEDLNFPKGFKFGVASAAYQVEGAWNVSDKGESIWDRFTHANPGAVSNNSNGDVACDSYHLWRQDIDLLSEVGAKFYRFSISWPRLLPRGLHHYVSEDGKNYYNNLIDGLLEKGIEPVVTLYHWDLPQKLQDLGGWANPLISDWFAEYARLAFSLYGDRVKTWITINEAWVVCDVAYMTGVIAPGVQSTEGGYICNKNLLMAHAKAWRIYDEELKPKYHGGVSLANHVIWMEPENEKEEEMAELVRELLAGRYSHPIYSKEGGWPPAIEKILAAASKEEGYPRSKLPAWTKEEIELVKGTYDFYGLNFYTSRLVRKAKPDEELRPWPLGDSPDLNAKIYVHPDWPHPFDFFALHPEGIRKQLAWLKSHYGDIPIMITENGRGTTGGLNDMDRIDYYYTYLKQVLLAIKEDGVNVTAYTAWTIIDNFEWISGYETKFGLYEVDFSSPNRTRTPRASAKFYAELIRTNSLDSTYNYTATYNDNVDRNAKASSDRPSDQTGESKSNTVILVGLVMVVILIGIAAVVGWKIRSNKKRREDPKNAVQSTTAKPEEAKVLLKQ